MPYKGTQVNRLPQVTQDHPVAIRPLQAWRFRGRLAVLALLLGLLLPGPATVWAAQVFTHPDVSGADINRQMLRAIFSMRLRQWPNGEPITVYVLEPSSPVHVAFCKEVLGILPHQLQRSWDRLVFSGMGQAPIEVESLDEMRRRVLATPGAIGYLEQDETP
jgi:hypothetical protein